MTDGKNTVGHDPKIPIRKKPAKDTGRDRGQIKSKDLRMAVDDLRNDHSTDES